MAEIVPLGQAVAELVHDGDTVALEGFTHLIPFGAGHEIIRQGRRDLTLVRMTPDMVYDQLIGMGCARRLVFSWGGNPGVGSLHRLRDAVEHDWPAPLRLDEHSHAGMANRYVAGASGLPFAVMRGYAGTDLVRHSTTLATISCPFTGEVLTAVPALRPDVTIVHAQRADAAGDTQVWGLLGCQKEAAFAADRVIVVVEELVSDEVIRADPNRTIIPGLIVDAVVVEPWGAHPSYVQGAYDRDNRFYLDWDPISRDEAATQAWLAEWVLGVSGRGEYIEKLGADRMASLRPSAAAPSGSVDYGEYR